MKRIWLSSLVALACGSPPPADNPAPEPNASPARADGADAPEPTPVPDPDVEGAYAPPIPEGARIVPQVALDPLFRSGERVVEPPADVELSLASSGKSRVVTTWKLCIDAGGRVFELEPLRGSGYPAWNGRIAAAMRAWVFEPFQIDGAPTPVCTAYTVIWNGRANRI